MTIAAAAPAYASSGAFAFSKQPSAEITQGTTPTHFSGTLAVSNSHSFATHGLQTYVFTATSQLGAHETADITFDMDLLGTLPSPLPPISVTVSSRNMTTLSSSAIPTLA